MTVLTHHLSEDLGAPEIVFPFQKRRQGLDLKEDLAEMLHSSLRGLDLKPSGSKRFKEHIEGCIKYDLQLIVSMD